MSDLILALNILTWNSEESLEDALQSVSSCVDLIYALDRFSTDGTLEILKRYNAQIFQKEFSGSFAAERNYLIDKTQADWILTLDSDEIVNEAIQKNIRSDIRLLEELNYSVGFYPRKNLLDNKLSSIEIPGHARLIKKNSNIRYFGKVHETVNFEEKKNACWFFSDTRMIIHSKSWKKQEAQNIRYSQMQGRKR